MPRPTRARRTSRSSTSCATEYPASPASSLKISGSQALLPQFPNSQSCDRKPTSPLPLTQVVAPNGCAKASRAPSKRSRAAARRSSYWKTSTGPMLIRLRQSHTSRGAFAVVRSYSSSRIVPRRRPPRSSATNVATDAPCRASRDHALARRACARGHRASRRIASVGRRYRAVERWQSALRDSDAATSRRTRQRRNPLRDERARASASHAPGSRCTKRAQRRGPHRRAVYRRGTCRSSRDR